MKDNQKYYEKFCVILQGNVVDLTIRVTGLGGPILHLQLRGLG
jgi:hypothetical protein